MKSFLIILISTFISVTGALATWHSAQIYLADSEAVKAAEVIDGRMAETKREPKTVASERKNAWKVEERTNPVTGERVATAIRFSEDIRSAVTFRCYGLDNKRFDILVSFPEAIDWNKGTAEMKFKVDGGETSSIRIERNSSSVAVPDINEVADVEKEYGRYPSLLKSFTEKNDQIRAFKKIGSASLFEASVPDGTIYQQTISINLGGVQQAIQPVLALCGKAAI